MQVCGLAKNDKNRLIGTAADGENQVSCTFSTKYIKLYDEKKLASNDLVKIDSYSSTVSEGKTRLMVLDMEVVGQYSGPDPLASAGSGPAQKKQKVDVEAKSPDPAPAQCVSPCLRMLLLHGGAPPRGPAAAASCCLQRHHAVCMSPPPSSGPRPTFSGGEAQAMCCQLVQRDMSAWAGSSGLQCQAHHARPLFSPADSGAKLHDRARQHQAGARIKHCL